MLFTDVQRSVRLNKKKKSTNTSPYPDEAIERLARAFYPAILACWNSEEGQREFAAWQAEQAHIATKEKQEVPAGELPALLIVCGFLQGASFGAHPVFFTVLHHFPRAASDTPRQHGSGSDAACSGIVPVFCAEMPYKLARKQHHFPVYCPIFAV